MTRPLGLPLLPAGARRSGLRWLAADGAEVAPGDPLAYCTLGFDRRGHPLPEERRDLQLVLVAESAGRLRRAREGGGFQDLLAGEAWVPGAPFGALDGDGPEPAVSAVVVAGRRGNEVAEDRVGLASGWHDRLRAWRLGPEAPAGSLLSLGVCELVGVVRGARWANLELVRALPGLQIGFSPDEPPVPSARFLLEQLLRSDAERDAIAADLARGLAERRATPADFAFAGALLAHLVRDPLGERPPVLTERGGAPGRAPDAVLLSGHAEYPDRLRHRALGYTLRWHTWRYADAGPALRGWLQASFVPEPCPVETSLADLRALALALRAHRPGLVPIVTTVVPQPGDDAPVRYAGLPTPLAAHLQPARALAFNLGLHDLAREGLVSVLDLDAVAAGLGAAAHLRGIHPSGALDVALRAELVAVLRRAGVPGAA